MKKEPNVVLIAGLKRSGKDYFAKMMKEEIEKRGQTADIFAYADPIKEILSTALNISVDDLNYYKNTVGEIFIKDDRGAYIQVTDTRVLIQKFGTEAMKAQFGEYVWVGLMTSKILKSTADYVLIPDFRFLCEHIAENTINIVNKDIVQKDTHRSENELNEFNFKYTVDNTGQVDLMPSVNEILDKLKH